jgi:hypothetical protein
VPYIDDADPAVQAAKKQYENTKKPNGNGPQCQSRARNWQELIAMPKPVYIIKSIIERGVLAEIYGPTQSGKSFLATDLALHVAFGWSWCGKRVRRGGVLYISAEGGTAIVRRLEAFAKHHDVKLDDIDFRAVIEPTNLFDHDGAEQLIADAQGVPNLVLVIIDTANRIMPGSKEDAEAMGKLVAACDMIRLATGAAVLLVHHSGKDIGRGSRGSSVLPAAVDVNISVTKNWKISTVELEKQRDGETGSICSFTLKVIDLGLDEDKDPTTSCVVEIEGEPGKRTAKKSQPRLNSAAKIALQALHKAINEAGQNAPETKHYPPNARVVSYDTWRRFAYTAKLTDAETPEAQRQAFFRAARDLQGAEIAKVWNDLVWIVQA